MMAPIELIRWLVPTRIRIKSYVWAISIARRHKWLLYPFLFLLHGHIPQGITVVDGKPLYHYNGIKIDSPGDSVEAYVEVFHDKVYDRGGIPQKGDVVIDIGAYVGMYSIRASKLVGSTGLVVAVEPLPSNLAYLENNLDGLSNIKVVGCALSNYVGKGELYSSPSTAAHSMTYKRKDFIKVKVTTLDRLVNDLGLSRVDYIKMDAEGSDLNILAGATNVLMNNSPVLSMACYHADPKGKPYFPKVIEYLKNFGYKCVTEKGYVYARKEVQ